MTKSLILTGMMGAGKTRVGEDLSSLLGFPFIDSDLLIYNETGLKPGVYIRRFGEHSFRKLEKRFLRKCLSNSADPFVLATGGGIVIDSQNRSLLLRSGFVVWLDPTLRVLLSRLKTGNDRGVLAKPVSLISLKSLYESRKPFYRKCHLRVACDSASPKAVAMDILKKYRETYAS